MRLLCTLAVLAILFSAPFAFAIGDRPPAPSAEPARIGAMAPDITLKDMKGNAVTLSQYRGKVVFLNFWATWCPPCRMEMPSMERLNEVYGGQGLVMLAVNVEKDAKDLKAFLKESPHSFAVLHDADAKAQRLYGVYRFPETFLIDKKGRIAEHVLGALDWSSVEVLKRINDLIKE